MNFTGRAIIPFPHRELGQTEVALRMFIMYLQINKYGFTVIYPGRNTSPTEHLTFRKPNRSGRYMYEGSNVDEDEFLVLRWQEKQVSCQNTLNLNMHCPLVNYESKVRC